MKRLVFAYTPENGLIGPNTTAGYLVFLRTVYMTVAVAIVHSTKYILKACTHPQRNEQALLPKSAKVSLSRLAPSSVPHTTYQVWYSHRPVNAYWYHCSEM